MPIRRRCARSRRIDDFRSKLSALTYFSLLTGFAAASIGGLQPSFIPPAAAQVSDTVQAPDTAQMAAGQALRMTPSDRLRVPQFWQEDDGQWRMAPKNYASTRFSTLDQITTENVDQLEVAWTFSTGEVRGHEAAPLVVGNTMYVVTPFPNKVFAIDLEDDPGTLRWSFNPKPARAAQGVACCDVVNRGMAYSDGMVFFNTLDNHTIALNAESGEEVWRTRLGDYNKGQTMTMAPLVVKDKVLVGNSGGELGVRGWITALDVSSGEIVWRGYSTGPDDEVLIDHDFFEAQYPQYVGEDLGVKTWPPEAWKIGGGTVWGWISYDPDLDLIYHGTANPGPWNPDMRPGDNLFTAGIFARDPDDGRVKWFYQWAPHDHYDYDGINENILLDMEIDGEVRPILLRPDRRTGEVLSADPFVPVTWASEIDLETGRPVHVEGMETTTGEWIRNICPAAPGAKDWQPSAYSPRTGLLYAAHNHLCMDEKAVEVNYISGTPYVGAEVVMYGASEDQRGAFMAWDPVERRKVWSIPERWPAWSGVVVTAGDVAFYGTMEGYFKAVHAVTGEVLWQFKTGSGIIGQPITYRGPDGVQYVAILAGVGGWAGAPVLIPTDSPTAFLGFAGATMDLADETVPGGMLYVFALNGGRDGGE